MDYWSFGVSGMVEADLFLYEWQKAKPKNRPSSIFNLQYSMAPVIRHRVFQDHPIRCNHLNMLYNALN